MSIDMRAGSPTDAEIMAAFPVCDYCGRKHYANYPCAARRARQRTAKEAPSRAEATRVSAELAEELGQKPPLVVGDGHALVRSRTDPGMAYRVDFAADGTLICSCPASAFGRDCWHQSYVREELNMSETSTAIVPVKLAPVVSTLPSEREMALINQAAAMAYAGNIALPKELDTKEKVAAVMLYGWEQGLRPMTALKEIFLVEGRPTPSTSVMIAVAKRNDPTIELIPELEDGKVCRMHLERGGRVFPAYTVSMTDPDVQNLVKKDTPRQAKDRNGNVYTTKPGGWVAYPRDRLRWHCAKRLLRIYAPDAVNGLIEPAYSGELVERRPPVSVSELYNDGDEPEEGDVREIVEAVADAPTTPPTTVKAVGCEHEPQMTQDGLYVCSRCGEMLDARDVEKQEPSTEAQQAALV